MKDVIFTAVFLVVVFAVGVVLLFSIFDGESEEGQEIIENQEQSQSNIKVDEEVLYWMEQIEDPYVLKMTELSVTKDIVWTSVTDEVFKEIFVTTYDNIEFQFRSYVLYYKKNGELKLFPCKVRDLYALHDLLNKDDKEEEKREFKEFLELQRKKL